MMRPILLSLTLLLNGLGTFATVANAVEFPDEKVKLLCDLDIETVWVDGSRTDRVREQVAVDVERVSGWLYIQADGKGLFFTLNTHKESVEDRSDTNRWQLFDTFARGGTTIEKQVTIDRNSGRFSYFLSEPIRQITATGPCSKIDQTKRAF